MSIESVHLCVTTGELNEILADINKLMPTVKQRRSPEETFSTQCCEELYLLLNGSPLPAEKVGQLVLPDVLCNAVAGGYLIDGSEQIEGPFLGRVRYLTAEQVQEITSKLNELSYEELSVKKVIESIDNDEMEEEFAAFKDFFSNAAGNDKAVLSYFTD